MATRVQPNRASRNSTEGNWWGLRVLLRAAMALVAFVLLLLADDREKAWVFSTHNGGLDNALWFAWVGLAVAAGIAFGLATWLPFTKLRYLSSRLLLAALALLPPLHFWWVFIRPGHEGPFGSITVVDEFQIQYVCAALAGVAIASGFRTRALNL